MRKLKSLPHYRAFEIEFVSPTANLPARVRITDLRFDKSVVVNYGAETPNTKHELAVWWLGKKEIKVIATAWAERGGKVHEYSLLLTDNFTIQIK